MLQLLTFLLLLCAVDVDAVCSKLLLPPLSLLKRVFVPIADDVVVVAVSKNVTGTPECIADGIVVDVLYVLSVPCTFAEMYSVV